MSVESIESMPFQTVEILFGKIYEAIVGSSHFDFRFTKEVPLSSSNSVFIGLGAYLVFVFLLQRFMSTRKPISVKGLFAFHNACLSFLSLILFILLLNRVIPSLQRHSFLWTMCSVDFFVEYPSSQIVFYLNYISKYVELIDTLFLCLNKSNLRFLHVYHHALTMVLCWVQLEAFCTIQWIPIVLNLFVHVVMYYYFFLTAVGYRPWWRQAVTILQITQFILDIIAVYSALYLRLLSDNYPFPTFGIFRTDFHCAGSYFAAFFGAGLLSSYLFLFVQLFLEPSKPATPKPATTKQSTIDKKKTN
eukprot:TRINITY_DN334_c0_g1_i1.p1 TRINITY_DN334_c0_g1~~TRINITY_DN334_c0_g1_i1.p1  ORF type:complete len:304 (+),score=70.09 TRINITY_DN334_c0_g1_i1:148-1059(+)